MKYGLMWMNNFNFFVIIYMAYFRDASAPIAEILIAFISGIAVTLVAFGLNLVLGKNQKEKIESLLVFGNYVQFYYNILFS